MIYWWDKSSAEYCTIFLQNLANIKLLLFVQLVMIGGELFKQQRKSLWGSLSLDGISNMNLVMKLSERCFRIALIQEQSSWQWHVQNWQKEHPTCFYIRNKPVPSILKFLLAFVTSSFFLFFFLRKT